MKNKILIFAAIGVGALLLLSGKKGSSTTTDEMFTLPDGTRVPVSQLPSLGYVFHEGQWKHQSQLTTPNMPDNVDPNSPQWLNILNTALESGSQLYSMSSELASAISKSIKSTAVNWLNNSITVSIKFGFQVYNGVITPSTNVSKIYSDQEIKITSAGQQVKIRLLKAGVLQKEATIDFTTKKLIGFSAGSVGISGYGNIDTVTSMYGIGSLKKEINSDIMALKYFVYNLDTKKIEEGHYSKWEAEEEAEFGYPNAVVYSLAQLKARGIPDPRQGWRINGIGIGNPLIYALALEKAKERLNEQKRYGEIGSIYPYNHPKGLTHCQDGTYSDAAKGACSYHGGAHEIKLRKGMRDYSGKGKYDHYMSYRKAYKNSWAKQNRASKSDRVVTL
jgi:hypothetical protein